MAAKGERYHDRIRSHVLDIYVESTAITSHNNQVKNIVLHVIKSDYKLYGFVIFMLKFCSIMSRTA